MQKTFDENSFWIWLQDQLHSLCLHENTIPETIAYLAYLAMLMEVSASPKPGLVCPNHNGAHKDMDYTLFIASATALRPYLYTCAHIGITHANALPIHALQVLRHAGLEAERTMFSTTKGINTHKGMIFSMGLMVAATGRCMKNKAPLSAPTIAHEASLFVQGIVEQELIALRKTPPKRPLTTGEKLFLDYGITGIRHEAENGFPTALYAHAQLTKLYKDGLHMSLALPHVLLEIIAISQDTNIFWRGGKEGLSYAKDAALKALQQGGMTTEIGRKGVYMLQEEFTKQNLSPGGSADLLAVAVFLLLLEEIIVKKQ